MVYYVISCYVKNALKHLGALHTQQAYLEYYLFSAF